MHSSEVNAISGRSPEIKPILGLTESAAFPAMEGTPIRFALFSNRTAIYRDRTKRRGGFITGTVDDEAWQTFEKIVAELAEVKNNFAFSAAENQPNRQIIFNDGKRMRLLTIYGSITVKKTGRENGVTYSTLVPAIEASNPWVSTSDVPQCALGAWYEMHFFVPKDAHPWIPDHFEVYLSESRGGKAEVSMIQGPGGKTVSWPLNWPQLSAAKSLDHSNCFSMELPGKYLSQFEQLFRKSGTAANIAGRTFFVSYSIPIPSGDQLTATVPVGVTEESLRMQPALPLDFLQTTKLIDIKTIAQERGYDMMRIKSPMLPDSSSDGACFVQMSDIIEELCQSNESETVDTGLTLTIDGGRNPGRSVSLIATTHSPEFTEALIVRHLADNKFLEIITPLIQEAVARGADYDAVQSINEFWQKLRKQNEPIAWLPLHTMDVERSTSMPSYSHGGSVSNLPSTTVNGKLEKQAVRSTAEKTITTTALPLDKDAAVRCVRSWKSEAKLFETSVAVSAADISPKQLLKLQLECLAGAGRRQVNVEVVTADRIFKLLFGAASNGGPYNHGEYGGYGRLAAWQTLAELTGVASGGTFDSVYDAVKQSDWCSISSESKWFYNIAWDIGIVCVRPDKRHIAVLMATAQD